jgi:hypothetical protein
MSARNRRKICAYCGKPKKLTKDHVPPKLLLEQPYPPNLWTVPACEDCNASFKADDEYTRAVLTVDLRANWNNAAQSNLRPMLRSLQHPNALGFAKYLAGQSKSARVLTPTGSPVMVIEPDTERINKTGARIMRGLYYRESGNPVPETAAIVLASKAGLTADHPDVLTMARIFNHFSDWRNGNIGTAFSYVGVFGPQLSIWGMLLYDYFFWCGSIDERSEAERDREP